MRYPEQEKRETTIETDRVIASAGSKYRRTAPPDRDKMSFVPVNPRPFLLDLVNKDVIVRLKWGETEYKGRLVVRVSLYP